MNNYWKEKLPSFASNFSRVCRAAGRKEAGSSSGRTVSPGEFPVTPGRVTVNVTASFRCHAGEHGRVEDTGPGNVSRRLTPTLRGGGSCHFP